MNLRSLNIYLSLFLSWYVSGCMVDVSSKKFVTLDFFEQTVYPASPHDCIQYEKTKHILNSLSEKQEIALDLKNFAHYPPAAVILAHHTQECDIRSKLWSHAAYYHHPEAQRALAVEMLDGKQRADGMNLLYLAACPRGIMAVKGLQFVQRLYAHLPALFSLHEYLKNDPLKDDTQVQRVIEANVNNLVAATSQSGWSGRCGLYDNKNRLTWLQELKKHFKNPDSVYEKKIRVNIEFESSLLAENASQKWQFLGNIAGIDPNHPGLIKEIVSFRPQTKSPKYIVSVIESVAQKAKNTQIYMRASECFAGSDEEKAVEFLDEAVLLNDPEAHFRKANYFIADYAHSKTFRALDYADPRIKEAMHHYTMALKLGHPLAALDLGLLYFDRAKYDEALDTLEHPSINKTIPSLCYQAFMHLNGLTKRSNVNEALNCISLIVKKLIENGDPTDINHVIQSGVIVSLRCYIDNKKNSTDLFPLRLGEIYAILTHKDLFKETAILSEKYLKIAQQSTDKNIRVPALIALASVMCLHQKFLLDQEKVDRIKNGILYLCQIDKLLDNENQSFRAQYQIPFQVVWNELNKMIEKVTIYLEKEKKIDDKQWQHLMNTFETLKKW